MAKIALILGGGDGTRAGGPLPKQFQEIGGKSVLRRSVEAFLKVDPATKVYVVVHPSFLEEWDSEVQEIAREYGAEVTVVCGGERRWHSVGNGLLMARDCGMSAGDIVAVHDGARPLVPASVIEAGWKCAEQNGTAVPAVPLTDSIRRVGKDGKSESVRRSDYVAVQTPQVFRTEIINDAYSRPYSPVFTDDASVVEAAGYGIHLYSGSPLNIKITNPLDFKIAALILGE